MMYEIFEGNMKRLEKKLTAIYNKCQKYGCQFHYHKVGEVFREIKDEDGRIQTAKFIQVEVEGHAIVNDWEFVATVQHTEKGNIFSGPKNMEIPERYYDAKPVCEHCNSNRYRKYTYIVRNKVTGEFKQVGKSCLNDFTHGMSAEYIAQYISMFDALIEGQAPTPGSSYVHYLNVEEFLSYVAETIRHFGYVKPSNEEDICTGTRALDSYYADRGITFNGLDLRRLQASMERIGFDHDSKEARQSAKEAMEWVLGCTTANQYLHNLKTVCSLEYVEKRYANLLASLFPTYQREKAKKESDDMNDTDSRHVGNVGDKISVNLKMVRCVSSFETKFGTKRIYKFMDKDNNVYVWKTGVIVAERKNPENAVLTGIVKEHVEFRGVKQTELSHCKVICG